MCLLSSQGFFSDGFYSHVPFGHPISISVAIAPPAGRISITVFSVSLRELKHRTMKEPDEPKFELKQYVDREMRTAGCCRS